MDKNELIAETKKRIADLHNRLAKLDETNAEDNAYFTIYNLRLARYEHLLNELEKLG